MRVLICGSRDWTDRATIRECLEGYGPGTVVLEGEARGADTLAREIAEELGFAVLAFPADWKRFGRAAGPIRNQRMLDEGRPDMVIAFHDDISRSRGTADMIRRAMKRGIPTKTIRHGG